MKKIIAMFSSLLIFAGVRAQTTSVRKETVKPSAQKPLLTNTSTILHKEVPDKGAPTQKAIKDVKVSAIPGIKGGSSSVKFAPAAMKETPATKPVNR